MHFVKHTMCKGHIGDVYEETTSEGEALSSSPSRAEKKSGGAQLRKASQEHFRKKSDRRV